MRVEVDPDLCTACAVCTDLCPEVFVIVDDVAVAVHPERCEEDDCCHNAAEACPTEAIRIYENE